MASVSRRKQSNPRAVKVADENVGDAFSSPDERLTSSLQSRDDDVVIEGVDLSTSQEIDDCDDHMSNRLVIDDDAVMTTSKDDDDRAQGVADDERTDDSHDELVISVEPRSTASPPINGIETIEEVYFEEQELSPGQRESSISSETSSMNGGSGGKDMMESMSNGEFSPGPGSVRSSGSKSRRKTDRILPTPGEDGQELFACPVCNEVLPSNHDLTKHIRSHNLATVASTTNSCTICGKVLSSQSSLDRHMLVHSGERPFECRVCGMAFTTNGNMHRHMRIHDKEMAAGNVDGDAPLSLTTSPQVRTPRGKKIRVGSQHGSAPGTRSPMEENNLTSSATKRRLPIADTLSLQPKRMFFDNSNAVDKYIDNSDDMESNVDDVTLDDACQSNCDHKDRILLRCPVCNDVFFTTYGLSCHVASVHGTGSQYKEQLVLQCPLCRINFSGLLKLDDHMRLAHLNNEPGSDLTACDANVVNVEDAVKKSAVVAAGRGSFTTSSFFQEMMLLIDFSSAKFALVAQTWSEHSPTRRSQKAVSQPSSCRLCERSFPCSAALELHVSSFHGPSKLGLSCSSCDISFETRVQRDKHLHQCHDSSMVVSQFCQISSDCDPHSGDIGLEEFLLTFGLRTSPNHARLLDLASSSPVSKKNVRVDANQNLVKAAIVQGTGNQTLSVILSPVLAISNSIQQMFTSTPQLSSVLPQSCTLPVVTAAHSVLHPAFNVLSTQPVFMNTPSSLQSLTSLTAMGMPLLSPLFHTVPTGNTVTSGSLLKKLADAADLTKSSISSSPGMASNPDLSSMEITKSEVIEKDEQNKSGSYNCQLCDEIFVSYRAFRGHMMSTHLGTSPYKCTQCAYASADRSTLIRHLRTHNGERPFQCLICDFAFTTKANCERHVRKKHGRETKEEMEGAIGYNRSSKESSVTSDGEKNPTASGICNPMDTVCKYCGEDFKFYRTLKHHLRSQTSCMHKPFTCRVCSIGFSTKPNCLRHIQKQHPSLIVGVGAESQMTISETVLAAQQHAHMANSSVNGNDVTMKRGQTPLMDHNKRQCLESSAGLPLAVPSYHSPVLKSEKIDVSDDQPLDFSLKSASSTVSHVPQSNIVSDEPMDLTTGPPRSLSTRPLQEIPQASAVVLNSTTQLPHVSSHCSITPSLLPSSALPAAHQPRQLGMIHHKWNMHPNRLHCQHCNAVFRNIAKLRVHLRSHSADRTFHCHHCLAGFALKTSLDNHMKTSHPQFANYTNDMISTDGQSTAESLNENENEDTDEIDFIEPNNNIPSAVNANLWKKDDNMNASPHMTDSEASSTSWVMKPLSQASSQNNLTLGSLASSKVLSSTTPLTLSRPPSSGTFQMSSESAAETSALWKCDIIGKLDNSDTKLDSPGEAVNEMGETVKRKRNSYADSPHKLCCPYCPRAFPWISSLKRHILTHTGQKPFRCPQCPVTFSTKSNRERHMIRKHGLDVHDPATRQMMDRPYKCHLCMFSSFSSSGKLVRHYRSKHSGHDFPDGLLASIPNMSQDELNWALSKADHDGMPLNNGNERTDSDDTQDMDNDDSEEDDYDDNCDCDEGIEKSAAEVAVEAVVRAVAGVPTGSNSVIPTVLDTASVLRMPRGSASCKNDVKTSLRVNPERDNYNVDRITECWQCERVFDCRKSLLRHLKEHGVDLPFKCYLCDASFESRITSLQHKESAHATDWSLLREKNRVGSDLVDYAEFVDHVVEDALNGGTAAPATARRIRDGVELDIRLETDYAQRKVFCSLCPKRFWSLQDLRRHMRSHTGERPFECDVCHARFTLKHSMMRHRRKHEGAGVGDGQSDTDDDSLQSNFVNGERTGAIPMKSEAAEYLPIVVRLPDLIQSMPKHEIQSSDPKEMASSSEQYHPVTNVSAILPATEAPSDLLQNLLGVADSLAIDKMLDSADRAAALLGVETTRECSSTVV